MLLSVGKKYESITLEADARHLMTDVWTSIGVIGGLVAVTLTGWQRLDPVVAIAVALNIVWSGYSLVHRSVLGLLDTALPTNERQTIARILEKYESEGIQFHAIRSVKPPPAGSCPCMSWFLASGLCGTAIKYWSGSKSIFAMLFAM